MKLLSSFVPAFILASTVLAEPTAATYPAPEVPFEGGYTRILMMEDGTLEHVVAFTGVTDESSPHIWQVPANIKDGKIDYLVVAGGGGGGAGYAGGGGGAGGMLMGTLQNVVGSLKISVGNGGTGGKNGTITGENGEDSFIKDDGDLSIIAKGGGAGGSGGIGSTSIGFDVVDEETGRRKCDGAPGGSGGGAAGGWKFIVNSGVAYGGAGVDGQGNKGGDRDYVSYSKSAGTGGGGAGGIGTSAQAGNVYAHGGDGKESLITGEGKCYAGGGGGASYDLQNFFGYGGEGGGGRGGAKNANNGESGTPNTGGGGGGACESSATAGSGGSGIVVLRYALADEVFDGIFVEMGGESNVDGKPSCVFHREVPANNTYTCPKHIMLHDGVRATCIGWELWNYGGTIVRSYESDNEDEEVVFTREENEKKVVLKWLFVREYYVATVAKYASSDEECTRGSLKEDKSGWYRAGDQIKVEIASTDNFIGWGGWGKSADRPLASTVNFTVGTEPLVCTAYFTAHDKDNIVLNGDFEIFYSSKYSDTKTIQQNFDWLSAGNWNAIQYVTAGTSNQYPSGLLSSTQEGATYSLLKVLDGKLSAAMGSKPKGNTNYQNPGSIYCNINVSCAGIYDFSFSVKPSGANYMKATSWEVNVYLVSKNGEETRVLDAYQEKGGSKDDYSAEVAIRKAGIYTLIVRIDKERIVTENVNVNTASAVDNISLCLDKPFGFSIKVR